ncbi:YtpR family tRNA-binding protein [Dellaglioa sp. P0083]|uniref:YtpR family tRNA-binding protein n=1 Tax=Dellaglioa kimchii TaxID=3344667 RepID=UPI0038D3DFB6
MLITSYNLKNVGDTLMVVLREDVENQKSESKNNVVRIFNKKSNETLGFNFLEISKESLDLVGNGQIFLDEKQVEKLNQLIVAAGFKDILVVDDDPKFVVGYVAESTEHPDSDHLHVTKIEVNNGETLDIVCGASNIEQGQLVVVAKVGAMMPTGAIIWPGKLRGIDSYGMVCSAQELAIPNAPTVHGILVLDEKTNHVGDAFDFEKAAKLFA